MDEVFDKFNVGEKVKVIGNQGFEIGVTGVVDFPPRNTILSENFGDNYFRQVQTLQGEKTFVWVVFDTPQFDADGDGPYPMAEINTEYLEIIK